MRQNWESERAKEKRGDFTPLVSFCHKLPVFYYLKEFYWLNNDFIHKNSFIGPKTFFNSFYSFTRCFASFQHTYVHLYQACCQQVYCTPFQMVALGSGPMRILDPNQPMTYQHAPRHRVHQYQYTMSFGDANLYLSRLGSFLDTYKCPSNKWCQVFMIQAWQP